MAALTAQTQRRIKMWGYSANYNWRIANAVTIYRGSYCMIPGANSLTSTRGYARPWTAVQKAIWIGLAIGSPYNQSTTNTYVGDTSASVVPEVTTEAGPFVQEQATVTGVSAQSDVRQPVYASSDNDLTLTAPGGGGAESTVVGRVVYWWSSTTADVLFYGYLAGVVI